MMSVIFDEEVSLFWDPDPACSRYDKSTKYETLDFRFEVGYWGKKFYFLSYGSSRRGYEEMSKDESLDFMFGGHTCH